MKTKLYILTIALCLTTQSTIFFAASTHVYVYNCTSLRFEVSIEYEGTLNTQLNYCRNGVSIIAPYTIPEEKNMVLAINRLLPLGEHLYTIKLTDGPGMLCLKQKFVSASTDTESEIGISLASTCLHDPWFMNNQAKERHEHLASINGHTIVVVYYAYDNNNSEDIEYILYERLPASQELINQAHICGKTLTYNLPIPIIHNIYQPTERFVLKNMAPQTLIQLREALRQTKKGREPIQSIFEYAATLHQNSCFDMTSLPDLQKILNLPDPEEESAKEHLHTSTISSNLQATASRQQQLIDLIAHNKSWCSAYSVEESQKTHFWVSRNKLSSQ